jgi:hypothetical protein
VAPWTTFWDRNGLTDNRPRLESVIESPYVRGAATGVGLITMLAGMGELAALFASRWHSGEATGPADDTSGA